MNEELFKDYVPEIMIYNPEVDGSYEHKIREEHLDVKALLLEKIKKAKARAKAKVNGTASMFRQPIRTENED